MPASLIWHKNSTWKECCIACRGMLGCSTLTSTIFRNFRAAGLGSCQRAYLAMTLQCFLEVEHRTSTTCGRSSGTTNMGSISTALRKRSWTSAHTVDMRLFSCHDVFRTLRILCVEPSIANFKILTLNTAPYQNIKCVHGAVWNESAELNLVDRLGGHWGSIFRIAQDESTVSLSETTQAYTVNELLTMASWPRVDYVKCDIEGAELEVFSDPAAAGWLANVHCISVETHDRFRPGCTDAVETALPESHYDRLQSGEFRVFLARDPAPCHSCDDASSVEVVVLSPGTLKTRTFDLVNVPPHSWGFEVVDEETFQLHPNVPGQPPAEIRFQIDLNGQSRFTAMCQLAAEARDQVSFGVRLVGGGRTAIAETITVTPGEKAQFEVAIPRRKAAYELILSTQMAEGATSNGNAKARWQRPVLR